jgi:hypothetical protein
MAHETGDFLSTHLISLHTQPGLHIILLRAFRSILATGNCSFHDTVFSGDEELLVDSQTAIGWKHLLFGRFSLEWARIQEGYTCTEKLDPKFYNGKAWTTKVTKLIWRAFRALWLLRNADLHGITLACEPAKRARLAPLVTHIYEHIHQLDPHDREMLRMPLVERLALPLSTLITWVSTIQPAFEEARIRDDTDFDLEEALALNLEIEAGLLLLIK